MVGSVRGYVVRADNGAPVAEATIVVVRGAGPMPDLAPITDMHGFFALDGLPEGNWQFRAQVPSGEVGDVVVRVCDNAASNTTIVVASAEMQSAFH